MARLLILEDDGSLNRSVCVFLSSKGFETTGCLSASEALGILQDRKFDLIVSDVMMKNMDGFGFAEAVRSFDDRIPIIFMTALDDIDSKTKGFRIGIDDYIVKPVDLDELHLRILAILRRVGIEDSRRLEIGGFVMDRDEFSATNDGEEIPLTKREFDILFKLLSNPRKTFTRTQLLDEVWDWDTSSGTRAIDIYITKLRSKLSACTSFEIVTVHGLGYKAVVK